MIKHIVAKLGNMRREQEFVVYPDRGGAGADNSKIVIQSDTRICSFDPVSRKGMLSTHRANGAHFVHLSSFMGATEIEVPQDVVDAALAAKPHSGDIIGGSAITGVVRVA